MPLRYWALCKILAEQGHDVIWWSSDFSHLTKTQRAPCPETDGFAVRLIETPPYTKNISFARLKNHKAFADGFYADAMEGLRSGELNTPDRIVVSLPPLGVAEKAFAIRDAINLHTFSPSHLPTQPCCEVTVDIMDAWPETFYQALPKPLRKVLGPILLAPMHRSATRAYQGADKISAVGQSYLNLAAQYLKQRTEDRGQKPDAKTQNVGASLGTPAHQSSKTSKPMFLCYHGTDLERFALKSEDRRQKTEGTDKKADHSTNNKQQTTNTPPPLRAVYLGSMGQGYDLMTIIKVAARWKAEGVFPFQIHFAGSGSQANQLMTNSKSLIADQRIVFHGQLGRDAVNELLLSADLALVPNRPDSLVACPYKAGEYAAAGLPMLSCLRGELGQLLNTWNAGSGYNEGDVDSLDTAFKNYPDNLDLLNQQSLNAKNMAEKLFDRKTSYQELTRFILS